MRPIDGAALRRVSLAGVRVLSLDVFDTCLGRRVMHPTDVFALVGAQLRNELPTALADTDRFRAARVDAERRSRLTVAHGETSLAHIYESFAPSLEDAALVERVQGTELDCETAVSVARPATLDLARRAVAAGARIVYASDMYLPGPFIGELLARAGFPLGDVLVSNEVGGSKRSGALFAELLDRTGSVPGEVLHIGDNRRADGLGARRAGIRSVIVRTAAAELASRRRWYPIRGPLSLADSVSIGYGANLDPAVDDPSALSESIGARLLGPTLIAFAGFVAEQSRDPEEVLLFSSRDCRQLQHVYESIRGQQAGASPETRYLHTSRRAVGVPALAHGIVDSDRPFLLGGRQPMSIRQLFHRVDLDDAAVEQATTDLGADPDAPLAASEREHAWAAFRRAETQLVSVATAELEAFSLYWRSLGMPTAGKVCLVDIGWRASVLASLQRCVELLGWDVRCRGLYLALTAPPPPNCHARGFIVDAGQPRLTRYTLESGVPLVEQLTQANEGSTMRYTASGPEVGPAPIDRGHLDLAQRAAGETVRLFTSWGDIGLPTRTAVRPLLRTIATPSQQEMRWFGALRHTDSMGESIEPQAVLPSGERRGPGGLVARWRQSEWRPGLIARTRLPANVGATLLVGLKVLADAARQATHARRPTRTGPNN